MIRVNIGNQSFPLPENWDDVISSGRYLDVVSLLSIADAGPGSQEIRYYIFERILFMYADGALEVTDIPEQLIPSASMKLIDECYPALQFIFDGHCTNCPLPVIEHKGRKWKGPGQYLMPMTGADMEECSHAYAEYQKTGNIKFLDNLISTLYKPRLKYIPLLKRQALATLPPLTKMGIKFWYESCEAWWFQRYRGLYISNGQNSAKPDSLTVSRLIRALAGTRRGTVEQVRKMPRDEIYFELSELDREREEYERSTKG